MGTWFRERRQEEERIERGKCQKETVRKKGEGNELGSWPVLRGFPGHNGERDSRGGFAGVIPYSPIPDRSGPRNAPPPTPGRVDGDNKGERRLRRFFRKDRPKFSDRR